MPLPISPALAALDPDAPAASGSGLFGLDVAPEDAAVVLIPVPFDATTSYGQGTAAGPAAILEASHQVDLFDVELGHPWRAGIAMLPHPEAVAAANAEARAHVEAARDMATDDPARARHVEAVDAASARTQAYVAEATRRWLQAGKIVGVVGGDHAAPLGSIVEHAARDPEMGILHIDAHADLRPAYEGFAQSHASIMHNVMAHTRVARLVQVGLRDIGQGEHRAIAGSAGRIHAVFEHALADAAMRGEPFLQQAQQIVARLPERVYLSLDIDGLDPSFCPHTGTPVPGGLSYREACCLIAEVRRSGRQLVGFDLMEVAPGPEGDSWDANVGARLLYRLCGTALACRYP